MGRPPKYRSVEEQREARRLQKRAWYESHKEIVSDRRARKRRSAKQGAEAECDSVESSPSSPMSYVVDENFLPSDGDGLSEGSMLSSERRELVGCIPMLDAITPPSDEDELSEGFGFKPARLDWAGCIPTVLSRELKSARRRAPLASRIESSCTFWRKFLQTFTRGDLVSLARTIFHDLCNMSDNNTAKFCAYKVLVNQLDQFEQMASDVYRHAVDVDPSGETKQCQVAGHLEKKVEHAVKVIQELILLRTNGAEHLRSMASLGCLVYDLV